MSASQFLAQEEVRRNIACYEGRESQSDRVAMLSLWMGILSLILREIHSFTLSHVSGLGSLILTMLVGLFCMIFVPLISLVGVGTGLVGLFSQRRVYKAVALTGFLINILPLIFTARVLRALPTGSLKAAVEIGSFTKRVGKNLLGQF